MTGAPPAPLGLRERKKLRTRHQLEDAALELFSRKGFDATTVEDIAAAAEVSPRTFFRYFASKEEVLLADDDDLRARLIASVAGRPAGEPVLTAVHRGVMAVADSYEADRERLFQVYRLMAETPSLVARSLELQTAWVEALAEEVGRRLCLDPAADLGPRLIARVSLSCLHAAAEAWFATGGRSHLPGLVDEAFTQVGRGLEGPGRRDRPGRRGGPGRRGLDEPGSATPGPAR